MANVRLVELVDELGLVRADLQTLCLALRGVEIPDEQEQNDFQRQANEALDQLDGIIAARENMAREIACRQQDRALKVMG